MAYCFIILSMIQPYGDFKHVAMNISHIRFIVPEMGQTDVLFTGRRFVVRETLPEIIKKIKMCQSGKNTVVE